MSCRSPDARHWRETARRRTGLRRGEAGAAGFLLKDAPAAELARAIRAAHAGRRVVDPGLGESRHYGTIAELAAALHVSHGTTRNYLSAIMRKLDAHSRMEAIRVAEERGWL